MSDHVDENLSRDIRLYLQSDSVRTVCVIWLVGLFLVSNWVILLSYDSLVFRLFEVAVL